MPRRTTTSTTPAATRTPRQAAARDPLTRGRIVDTAIDVADRDGLDAVSMRRLATVLDVDPMSLYNHVRDKDDLLDAMADRVIAGIESAPPGDDWRASVRGTILAARAHLMRHPWVPRVLEAHRDPGPASLAHFEAILAALRAGGFSIDLAHHALHVLGSRTLGFSQDLFVDSNDGPPDPAAAQLMVRQLAAAYPHIGELAGAISHEGGLGPCDDDTEFWFALDLILDGLESRRAGGVATEAQTRRARSAGAGRPAG